VTIDEAIGVVLARLGAGQVADLAAACESLRRPDGRLAGVIAGAPPGASDSITALGSAWRSQPELTGAGVALALRLGLAARQRAEEAGARPVWTGPGTVGEQRLTAGVLHELLAEARERILLISYAAFTLPEVAADLEAAVGRGCRVDVVFETSEDSAGAYAGPQRPFAQVAGINRWRWPAEHRDPGAVLHAKLLVIDGRRALVGSANLTARALQHNLEVGLLTRDPELSDQLEAHIRRLMSSGTLHLLP
jgi:phosphatidylserine/phosphatidylglycerophosphate/cardiolipin synthase-like enzyme